MAGTTIKDDACHEAALPREESNQSSRHSDGPSTKQKRQLTHGKTGSPAAESASGKPVLSVLLPEELKCTLTDTTGTKSNAVRNLKPDQSGTTAPMDSTGLTEKGQSDTDKTGELGDIYDSVSEDDVEGDDDDNDWYDDAARPGQSATQYGWL